MYFTHSNRKMPGYCLPADLKYGDEISLVSNAPLYGLYYVLATHMTCFARINSNI
jgi:hypothetical protein